MTFLLPSFFLLHTPQSSNDPRMSSSPASSAVQQARERAAELWRSPIICGRIADYLPLSRIARFLTVDKTTFNTLAPKTYKTCTLAGYLEIAQHGMIPPVSTFVLRSDICSRYTCQSKP
jgi:hypothetical protein